MLDPEIEKTRKSAYGVNHMILNRWSPRSFSGEDISDQTFLPSSRQQDGLHHHTTTNLGGSSMQNETQSTGIPYLICL